MLWGGGGGGVEFRLHFVLSYSFHFLVDLKKIYIKNKKWIILSLGQGGNM